MIQLDDGSVAIRITHLISEVRAYDHVPDLEALPDYGAGFVLSARGNGEVEARLAEGRLTRAHLRLLAKHCLDEGYRKIVVRRGEGRRVPLGVLREDGFWEIDLVAFRLSGRWRNV